MKYPEFNIRKGGAISKRNGLYDDQIRMILRKVQNFGGIYPKDVLPELKKNYWYIVNMDDHTGTGTHYVCLKNTKPMLYFDPLIGGYPPIEVLKKAEQGIHYVDAEIQPVESTACGWYCCGLILFDNKGNSLSNLVEYANMFKNNNISNDIILNEILKNEGVI